MDNWLTSKQFREKYGISSATLWRRKTVGTVLTKQMFGNTYYLDEDSSIQQKHKKHVIYCRVSNTKQKEDLSRQENALREYCIKNGIKPDYVYTDIASGMNEHRQGLNNLIADAKKGDIDTVYISYKDRLTRFGFGYFEYLFSLYGTKIEVVNLTKEEDFQQELTQDFISILHHFSKKLYSNRRKELKNLKKLLEND